MVISSCPPGQFFVMPANGPRGAVVLEGAERDRVFARAAETHPGWADYGAKTTRVIPVVALQEVPAPPQFAGGPNAASWGAALKLIHNGFRRELALYPQGDRRFGSRMGTQIRVNCLTVCQGLHHHHTGEDAGTFPFLAECHPELAPTLDRLRREHQKIAALLDALQEVISTDGTDRLLVLPEVGAAHGRDRKPSDLRGGAADPAPRRLGP